MSLTNTDTQSGPQVAEFAALSNELFFEPVWEEGVSELEFDVIEFARHGDGLSPVPGTPETFGSIEIGDGEAVGYGIDPEEDKADAARYRAARREYCERLRAYIAAVKQDDKAAA